MIIHRVTLGPVNLHLLIHNNEAVILDTGLLGEHLLIKRKLSRLGLGPQHVRAILLTHGHLDHAGNADRLRRWCNAPIYAHALEQQHLHGHYPYRGIARVCGTLENIGRPLTRYTPVTIDHHIEDGMILPFGGGLRVMHLPGHTVGHCGFYSAQEDMLFAGDLMGWLALGQVKPPMIFNSAPAAFNKSFKRVYELDPKQIQPNHYAIGSPEHFAKRFRRWWQKRR